MNRITSRPRGKVIGVSGLTIAALVLSLVGNFSIGHADNRVATASRASSVFVEPFASQSLWVGTFDPSLGTSLLDGDFMARIYAGLLKQVYDDKTGKFKIVPDLAAAMPKISKNGLVYTFQIRPD